MRGGSRKHIGNLAPEITDGSSLDKNCSCLYVSAHGETDLRGISVVPPNTFVVFIGQSGFSTPVAHGAEWIFYADSREEYFKGIFNTYFREDSPNSVKKRPYAAQHVYMPGDIIPLLSLWFQSLDVETGDQHLFFKGVYECPTRDGAMFTLPHTMTKIPKLIKLSENPEIMKIINEAKFRTKNLETKWKDEQKKPFHGILTSLVESVKKNAKNRSMIDDLDYWFENKKPITDFLDSYLLDHPDNLMKKGHLYLLSNYHSYLPYVLTGVEPTTYKKYKFVIVNSCRPPMNFMLDYPLGHKDPLYSAADPAALPKEFNKTRRFARRLSFATKPLETCATTDDPPMNMTKILNILIAQHYILNEYGEKEQAFIKELYDTFFGYRSELKKIISTKACMKLIADRSFAKYPILTDERPENAPYRKRFAELISAIHTTFGEFLKGIHLDNPADTREMKTLGQMILDQSGTLDVILPDMNHENILAAQQAFLPRLENKAVKSEMRNTTRKKGKNVNINTLLEWRISWKKGIRNPALNSKKLDEWSKYRRTLSKTERNAQDTEVKRRAKGGI